jgi:hypothetical protein
MTTNVQQERIVSARARQTCGGFIRRLVSYTGEIAGRPVNGLESVRERSNVEIWHPPPRNGY